MYCINSKDGGVRAISEGATGYNCDAAYIYLIGDENCDLITSCGDLLFDAAFLVQNSDVTNYYSHTINCLLVLLKEINNAKRNLTL